MASKGFDEVVLQRAYHNAQEGLPVLAFTQRPSVKFYKELNTFLKHWPHTSSATKTALGKLCMAIDLYLREKGLRPDNAFQYIERKIRQTKNIDEPMTYHMDCVAVVPDRPSTPPKAQRLSIQFGELESDTTSSKLYDPPSDSETKQCPQSETNQCLQEVLCDITQQMEKMKAKYEKQLLEIKQQNSALFAEMAKYEDDMENIIDQIKQEEFEVDIYKDQSYSENKQGHKSNLHPQGDSTIQITTKQGKAYVDTVRKLYYNLLTSGIPPAKVAPTIKEVLRHLLPSNDVTKLNLPKASTANYMRKEELRTICDVHKASELCNADTIHMNTDGTTLGQHKIAATSINGLVLSVNEVPNGSAEEIAKDISQELEKLRKIAHELNRAWKC